ncbi:MAG: tetratricopeptide repeat protein, partial [Nitrososphaerota archaeon]|nr:tetratricopeptide repeat protein [Nitrososphaerota archaeon]
MFFRAAKTPDDLIRKGISLSKKSNFKEAIVYFDKILDVDAKNGAAWFRKGLALRELGKYEESLMCFDKALEINPNNSDA